MSLNGNYINGSLHNIIENLTEGIYRIEIGKDFIFVNKAFLKITGFSSLEELNESNYLHSFYAGDNERERIYKYLRKEVTLINYETELVNKELKSIWVLENCKFFKTDDGREFIDGTILDISDMKLMQNKLLESNAQLLIKDKIESELEFRNRELATQILHSSQKQNLLDDIDFDLQILKKKYPQAIDDLGKISRKIRENNYLDNSWDSFKLHFEQVHPSFFNKLLDKHSSLRQGHLKQCAYIRIGLSNKEVAQLLNISSKGVEMARYRLKKKLNLAPEDSLIDYLFEF